MSSRPTYSCIRCADRKVKCDRQRPCSACVKHNVDCVFNPSPPARKKRDRAKHQILADRLRHYEALLQEQGIEPSRLPDTSVSEPRRRSSLTTAVAPPELQLQTPCSVGSEPSECVNKTQVVHGQGRSKFVDNGLWTRVVEEFHDPEDALEDSSDDASSLEVSDDDLGFVLSGQPKSTTRLRHPPSERIHQLWQIFIENVDPLTKVVHVPTLRPAIQKAASNIETIPRNFEALIFAIYGAAIMSIKDEECKQRFCEPRKTLLSRYISATKIALSRAKFMGTMSLVVLQALVLHLFSVRDIYEPRAVWSLTGVAVRIAQGMGLERDGESLGMPPFEVEMRRRIWWLLKTHDFRTAELCGLAKFRDLDTGAENTKWPTNVNDDELYPGMPSLPAESNALTDVVFVVLRYEFTNFAAGRIARFRQQGKNSSQFSLHASGSDKAEIEEAFKEVEELLETKYLRYCDPSQPLHLMTMIIARAAMNVIRFLTHHPRRWVSIEQTPLSERQWVWGISIKLLEQQNMVQSNPLLKQFAWHITYFFLWHVFIHVLDTLRADPLIADAEKAWRIICTAYESNPDMVFNTKKLIHVAVGNLCLKAYSARETALQNGSMCVSSTPEFILQLRQQREVAMAKRQARNAKSSQSKDLANHDQTDSCDRGLTAGAGAVCSRNISEHAYLQQSRTPRSPSLTQTSGDTSEYAHFQQNTLSRSPNLTQTGGDTESNPFWFIDGLDDSQAGNLNGMMDIDTDFMLAQDYSVKENATQTINWEQWDAWLVDSNVIRPLSSAGGLSAGN